MHAANKVGTYKVVYKSGNPDIAMETGKQSYSKQWELLKTIYAMHKSGVHTSTSRTSF